MAAATVPQAPPPAPSAAPDATPAPVIDLDSLTVVVVGNVQVVHGGTRWTPGEHATVPREVANSWCGLSISLPGRE